MTPPPGLRLWTGCVTLSGGVWEEDAGRIRTLLPEPLQAALQLPEDVTVTVDPDVAAEDGALLLGPGHPVLDRLAEQVLEEGEVRRSFLPWSRAGLPSARSLVAQARAAVTVAHGRLDAAGMTAGVYYPLLRVGALLTLRSGDEVRETLEVWVDGVTGLPVPREATTAAARGPLQAEPDPPHPVMPLLPAAALSRADALLRTRAGELAAELAVKAQPQMRDERERAEAYYAEELASLARRRAAAAPDRAALYDARAEATRQERQRRLQDIGDKYRPTWEIRPYLLHLVHVPGVRLPVLVRRGARTDPLPLTWLVPGRVFAGAACPRCGAGEALIATRDGLGCARCVASPSQPKGTAASSRRDRQTPPGKRADAPPAAAGAAAAVPRPQSGPSPRARAGRPAGAGAVTAREPREPGQGNPAPRPAAAGRPRPGAAASAPPRQTPQGGRRGHPAPALPARPVPLSLFGEEDAAPHRTSSEPDLPILLEALGGSRETAERAARIGRQLIGGIWQAALAPRPAPMPADRLRPGSPAAALQRLYGPSGVRLAVGIPAGPFRQGVEARWHTRVDPLHRSQVRVTSDGEVRVGPKQSYPFRVDWTLDGEQPLVVEVAPPAWCSLITTARDEVPTDAVRRLLDPAPPTIALDDVARLLWETDTGAEGLPFVVRCLTVWWRRPQQADTGQLPDLPARLRAAAIAYMVAQRSGLATARNHTPGRYGVDLARVKAAVAVLRPTLLPRAAGLWW